MGSGRFTKALVGDIILRVKSWWRQDHIQAIIVQLQNLFLDGQGVSSSLLGSLRSAAIRFLRSPLWTICWGRGFVLLHRSNGSSAFCNEDLTSYHRWVGRYPVEVWDLLQAPKNSTVRDAIIVWVPETGETQSYWPSCSTYLSKQSCLWRDLSG